MSSSSSSSELLPAGKPRVCFGPNPGLELLSSGRRPLGIVLLLFGITIRRRGCLGAFSISIGFTGPRPLLPSSSSPRPLLPSSSSPRPLLFSRARGGAGAGAGAGAGNGGKTYGAGAGAGAGAGESASGGAGNASCPSPQHLRISAINSSTLRFNSSKRRP